MNINRPSPPGGFRGGPPHREFGGPPPQLPPDYLKNGYFDNKGNILPQVIQEWPKLIADSLFKSRPRMTTSQLRGRFFNEVRRLETKLDAVGDFDKLRPEILKLKAYAEDAGKKNKVHLLFREFMERNVHLASKGEKEFRAFINHFECVVAYYPDVKGGA